MAKREKAPFVSKADRPAVKLKSDTPINTLTVRDLVTIIGQLGTGKDFWDGKDWQKDDFDGTNKPWKEGKEGKDGKDGKDKDHKEKREIKEIKAEKLEIDGVFEQGNPIQDPRIDHVIRAISGMTARIEQLADQIEALKKKG
jgi:hypothetical protein